VKILTYFPYCRSALLAAEKRKIKDIQQLMIKGKKISRKEIAEAAGVSDAMVSYALSDTSKVKIKAETRERIRRIAEEKGYMPNFIGRALVNRQSYNIGLLMPAKCVSAISLHYLYMLHGLSNAINDTEYCLSTFFGANDKYYHKIMEGRVDGIVIMDSGFDKSYVEKTINIGLPTVIMNLDYDIKDFSKTACIRPDHEKLISVAFDYFMSHNCKKILYINNPSLCSPAMMLYEAFNMECGKYASQGVLGTTIAPAENFSQQIENIFKSGQKWDAFLVNGNIYNIELYKIAEKLGLIPEKDFKVFTSHSCKNEPCKGPLYVHASEKIGKMAWEILYSMLNEKGKGKKILIPYEKI